MLSLYSTSLETELHTDASAIAFAAILLQKQASGLWGPIAYYSQATNDAESKYYELEVLAIVKAIERFHLYLYDLKFNIVSDCHAVVFAVNKANLNRVLRVGSYSYRRITLHWFIVKVKK